MFVLTGITPSVYPVRASGRVPYSWISASRITMVIDPATPPEDVAQFYQRIRKSDSYYGDVNIRPLAEKALMLAAFSATCTASEKPIDQVRRWNAEHPDNAYDASDSRAVGNFRRDLKQATERLLNPKLSIEGPRRQVVARPGD